MTWNDVVALSSCALLLLGRREQDSLQQHCMDTEDGEYHAAVGSAQVVVADAVAVVVCCRKGDWELIPSYPNRLHHIEMQMIVSFVRLQLQMDFH